MYRLGFLCLLVGFAGSSALRAQLPVGSIAGIVVDESGAVVPGARVTIVKGETGLVRDLETGADGSFSAASLPAGNYEVRAEASGFHVLLRPAIVETGATTTVNLTMLIGPAREILAVEAATAGISYDSNTVQGVVSRQHIQNLPLNGRSFLNLAQLYPGVIVSPANPAQFNAQFSVSVLGGPASRTAITIDGSNIRNPLEGGTGQNFSQEIVQEFQLSSVNFDLSTGLTAFGAINIATRSGDNALHGAAFLYFRDHNMSAYPSLNRNSLTDDPFFTRRQSGFWLGGPVKKDRMFFFGNFEYTNQNGIYVVQPDLPSLAHFASMAPAPYLGRQFGFKFDYRAGQRHTLFLRYSHDGNTNSGPYSIPVPPSNFVSNSNWGDHYTLGVTSVPRPSLVNDLRFSYWYWQNRNRPAACLNCPGSGGPEIYFAGVVSTNVVLGNNFNSPQGRDLRRYHVTDSIIRQVSRHRLKVGAEWERDNITGYWGFFDPARVYLLSPETLAGLGGAASYGLPDGRIHSMDDLLRLPVATYIIGIGSRDQPPRHRRDRAKSNNRYHLYVQDIWRIRQKFTVNYGLGWSFEDNRLNYDLPKPAFLAPLYGDDLSPTNKNYKNFSPAAGFAWSLGKSDKTVIRAGVGIFYDTQLAWWRFGERASLGPNGRQLLTTNVPAMTSAGLYRYLYGDFLDDLPNLIAQHNAIFPGTSSTPQIQIAKTAGDLGALFPKNFPTLQAQHVNTGVQHQISRGPVVTADFVYRHTIHETPGGFFGTSVDYNHFSAVQGPVIPKCTAAQTYDPDAACSNNQIAFWYPGGTATYRALLLKVDQRFARRFQSTASYALQDSRRINDVRLNLFNYNASYGPDLARNNLSISGLVVLPRGFEVSMVSAFLSRPAVQPIITGIDSSGSNTSASGHTALPGMGYNSFLGRGDLQRLVDQYNSTYAGMSTPAAIAEISPNQKYPAITLPPHYNLGHDFVSQDLRIAKLLRIREGYELRLIAEGFNIFNFGNLTGDSFILTSPAFGQPQQRVGQTFGTGGPRSFQFAGRFSF